MEYEIQARFTTTTDERKIIRDRLNKFTSRLGEKRCATTDSENMGGIMKSLFLQNPIHINNTSFRSKLNKEVKIW